MQKIKIFQIYFIYKKNTLKTHLWLKLHLFYLFYKFSPYFEHELQHG